MYRYRKTFSILLLSAGLASAQSYTAALRGVITDSSGAAVPSAQVVVTEAERNIKHTAVTDDAGRYFLSALPPGSYTLTVEAEGFNRHSQSAFTLALQQQATMDIQLQVGAVSSTIEVRSTAPLLNTTISSLGQVIENKYIISLPNIGRDSLSLAYLTPGVVGSAGRPGDTNTNFVANGGRNSTADVLVDGVTVTTVEQNSGITDLKYKPSVDAVQEFKMQTNFFPAEFGQTGGAAIQMITKSGSNDFHGTGFYFLRHSDFNANNWFSNRNGAQIPYFRRDQWGGVVGGPVIKNKTFFFATYENTKQKSPTTETQTVPTLLQREGNFSQTLNSSGQVITIYNPRDTFTNASGAIERRPFAGNIIPKSMMDPIALKMLSYFPLPNAPATITGTQNWFAQGVNRSPSQKMDFKGDHNFSDKNRLTGRYSFNRGDGMPANLFGEGNPAYTFNNGPNGTRTHSVVTDFTRAHSATTIWTVRYGLIYSSYFRNPMVTGFDLTTLGLPTLMKENATHAVFPTVAPEGYLDIGTEGYVVMDRQEGVHQFSGSVTKVLNAHNVKFGAELRNNFLDYAQPGYPSGRFAFGSQTTRKLLNGGSANLEGNGLASMLLGFGNGSNYHIDPKAYSRSRYMGFFVQDDWKVTRNLTLNLGLRYELDIPRWELQNRYSYWDTEAKSPIQVPGFDLRGVYKFVDDETRSPFNTDYNNFSPRIGFAWAVNEKTSIRSGGAILYSLSRATVTGHTGSGFTTDSQINWTLDNGATQYATLANPYPQGLLIPPGNSLGDRTFLGLGAGTIARDNVNPEMYSWNFSIQRELPWSSVLETNYTGSRGVHLLMPNTSLSMLDPQYWSLGRTALQTNRVANPFYGVITDPLAVNLNQPTVQLNRLLQGMPQYQSASRSERNAGDSNYHALQVKWEKRFSDGINVLTHYTWSKMIDNASASAGNLTWLGGTTSMQNPMNYDSERSLSAHDIPHRFVASGSWSMPFGTGRKFGSNVNRFIDAFIGGWEVSGVLIRQSGVPLQLSQSGGTLWNGTQRPNLLSDPSTSGRVQDRLNAYFNPAAFSQPSPDTFGSAPRYIGYRGPGVRTLNAAILKNWRVKEGQRIEFRLEAENATNTPIFNDPNGSFGASNFGQITGTRIGPRNVQLGFKYYF
jgi:hypothetical protein